MNIERLAGLSGKPAVKWAGWWIAAILALLMLAGAI